MAAPLVVGVRLVRLGVVKLARVSEITFRVAAVISTKGDVSVVVAVQALAEK